MGNIIAGITDPVISQTCALVPEACALIPGLVPTDAPTMPPTPDPCPVVSVDTCSTGQVKAQVTYDPTKCTGGSDEFDSLVYGAYKYADFQTIDGLDTLEEIYAVARFKRTCESPQGQLVDTFCIPSDTTGYLLVGQICPSAGPSTPQELDSIVKFEVLNGVGVTIDSCDFDEIADDGSLAFFGLWVNNDLL